MILEQLQQKTDVLPAAQSSAEPFLLVLPQHLCLPPDVSDPSSSIPGPPDTLDEPVSLT